MAKYSLAKGMNEVRFIEVDQSTMKLQWWRGYDFERERTMPRVEARAAYERLRREGFTTEPFVAERLY